MTGNTDQTRNLPPDREQRTFFVTGIHTDAGKTVASAVLALALGADYWKPVQAGDLDFGDTDRVRSWTGLPAARFHEPRFLLRTPASPHLAARIDGVEIRLNDFTVPRTRGRAKRRSCPVSPLIIEGAGGLLVPLNERDTVADLIARLDIPVILVSRHYLGSINHTLLSIDYLRNRNIPIAGLVYSGGDSPETVAIIRQLTGIEPVVEIPEFSDLTPERLAGYAAKYGAGIRKRLL